MSTPEGPHPLRSPQSLGDPAASRPAGAASDADPTAFRRLLERLESVAKGDRAQSAGQPDDLGALQDALDEADRDYQQVMDLRRQLEAAFRRTNTDS